MTHRSEVYGNAVRMLDALPEGSVVLDCAGDAWQKQDVRWTSVVRGTNTELMGSNSLAILTPLTVVHRGFDPESDAGVGWFEWFKMPENTTEIAYVHENGEVFDPVRGWNPVEFTIAAAEGRVHRLVRAARRVR